jgi:hypothetical protein
MIMFLLLPCGAYQHGFKWDGLGGEVTKCVVADADVMLPQKARVTETLADSAWLAGLNGDGWVICFDEFYF